jgi:glycosyltransferase involved in cell wall biosynthesis
VATKSPWPPVDGGRLLLAETLAALDVPVTLLTPEGPPPRRLRGLAGDLPLAIARHLHPALRARVAAALDTDAFDVVVAEQLHALPQCAAARERGVPVVLRAQNVESDLMHARRTSNPLARVLLRREARRLAAWEGAAVRGATATLALTEPDAARLRTLGGPAARVACVPAPFAADGLAPGPSLPGDPAVVVFGSRGWFPNHEAADWFVREAWPAVRARSPGAVLHLVGPGDGCAQGVVRHAPPADSAAAFPAGAILAVPLRTASGVRMKILEAWARGVPVVASAAAASGLDAPDALSIASTPAEFAGAIAALARDDARTRLVAAGRSLVTTRHRPDVVAAALRDALTAAVAAR